MGRSLNYEPRRKSYVPPKLTRFGAMTETVQNPRTSVPEPPPNSGACRESARGNPP